MNKEQLNELIPTYYKNKEKMESYKKLVDKQNKDIKDLMEGEYSYEVGKYKALVSTSTRVSMDEQKLMTLLKANNIKGVIKTIEVVDMDALENLIYHNEIPKDVLKRIGECKSEKEVKSLRVTKER